MESKGDDLWMDMYASATIRLELSAASVLENQGSSDFSFHDGFLPSFSSYSERNSSTDLVHEATKVIGILEDGEVRAMLQDAEVRAMLRKVTINEGVLNKTIQNLGGGEKGLKSLMGYILVWVKQQRDIQSSSQQPPPPAPSLSAWSFSTAEDVVLQPSSDAFQILSGRLQPPPTTRLLDQHVHPFQRSKSRKLMTRESEMGAGLGGVDTGFCPSSFISSPEDCQPKGTRPDTTAPCIPQQHISMPSVEPTPVMAKKAARKHRMTRQRESFHGQAASRVATTPVFVGAGSFSNTNAASALAVTSSGMSGAQTTPPRAPVTAAGEKEAERCMPFLATRGGVSLQMEDFDSGHVWNLRYRFWPNNKSRMYILENTAAFVISHGLMEGDLLVVYRVLQGGYVLRGTKKKNGSLDIEPV